MRRQTVAATLEAVREDEKPRLIRESEEGQLIFANRTEKDSEENKEEQDYSEKEAIDERGTPLVQSPNSSPPSHCTTLGQSSTTQCPQCSREEAC